MGSILLYVAKSLHRFLAFFIGIPAYNPSKKLVSISRNCNVFPWAWPDSMYNDLITEPFSLRSWPNLEEINTEDYNGIPSAFTLVWDAVFLNISITGRYIWGIAFSFLFFFLFFTGTRIKISHTALYVLASQTYLIYIIVFYLDSMFRIAIYVFETNKQ